MATNPTSQAIQRLRDALLKDDARLTDGQLLRCFVESRDEAAFAALLERHGPLVWNVCRRLLGDSPDAEDAFQATFLVLVRKAATIRRREVVAGWLYGVAQQTARQARRAAARRRAREKQVVDMPEPAALEDLWDDLQPLLDQELSRLSEPHRVLILLCDMEGKTRKEAARQLGLPEGTVASRLARARAVLARRLARHGLGVSGAALAALLADKALAAPVPAPVLASTLEALTAVAAGRATREVVSGTAAALTKGVMTAMLLDKLMRLTGLLLVIAALGGGAELLYRMQAAEPHKGRPADRRSGAGRDRAADDRPKRTRDDPIPPEARKAIEAGLKLLADKQHEDGSFGERGYRGNVGITSLAGLAFVAAGQPADDSPRGKVIARALDYVLAQQNRYEKYPGFLNNPQGSPHGPMYSHAFAALFLASVHGKVKDKKQAARVDEVLGRAVKLLADSQNKEGGWRYLPSSKDADSSVTACVLLALAAARQAGIAVPRATTEAGVGYLKKCFAPQTGGFQYMAGGGGKPTFARTAAAVAVLQALGIDKGDEVEKGLALVIKERPATDGRADIHYFYGHYYAVRALHGRGGKSWKEWYEAVSKDLLERHRVDGSWTDQIDSHYATAMACLVLLTPDGRLALRAQPKKE